MKIVFQHDQPLPVKAYGGIERILYWLMLELDKQGHEVLLIGHKDCQFQGTRIKLIIKNETQWWSQIPSDTDIIHLFYNFEVPGKIPTLIAIQGNGKVDEFFPINTVFCSSRHAQNHGASAFVHNALDFNEYPFIDRPINWNQFLFLAKASWKVKNVKDAIAACKINNKHLHIAGGNYWWPSKYIHGHGMVGGRTKIDIMNKCDALLWPVRWHEPFGIAIIEAMALGLPVIASPFGSHFEIITEESGVIVKNRNELIECVGNPPHQFQRKKIRQYVESEFSIQKLCQKYFTYYEKVIAGEKLNQTQPKWNQPKEAQELLTF